MHVVKVFLLFQITSIDIEIKKLNSHSVWTNQYYSMDVHEHGGERVGQNDPIYFLNKLSIRQTREMLVNLSIYLQPQRDMSMQCGALLFSPVHLKPLDLLIPCHMPIIQPQIICSSNTYKIKRHYDSKFNIK